MSGKKFSSDFKVEAAKGTGLESLGGDERAELLILCNRVVEQEAVPHAVFYRRRPSQNRSQPSLASEGRSRLFTRIVLPHKNSDGTYGGPRILRLEFSSGRKFSFA